MAGYLRIATEEAFAPPELMALWRDMLDTGTDLDPGFVSLVGFYARHCGRRASTRPACGSSTSPTRPWVPPSRTGRSTRRSRPTRT